MYKAARDVHTNGIHNTFTSKGRGKMNHIKQFFREKGLYLFCLAMVFAATAAGILALRTVVSNVADLTRTRKEALQNDSAWTQPDTAIDKPAQDVPKPTTTPAATETPSSRPSKPSRSVVVALTETASVSIPIVRAIVSRIRSIWGRSLGRCIEIVQSTLPTA